MEESERIEKVLGMYLKDFGVEVTLDLEMVSHRNHIRLVASFHRTMIEQIHHFLEQKGVT